MADADVQLKVEADVKLKDQERQQLATILECNVKDLPKELAPYARAALQEYLTLFLGQKVFTRGDDFREFRLFLLIKEGAFANKIPSEEEVSERFQTTASQSRSLIRSVRSKYHFDLQEAVKESLKRTVEDIEPTTDGNYEITVNNRNVVDDLNEILRKSKKKNIPRIMLKSRSISTYTMKRSAYTCLCDSVGVTAKKPLSM